MKDFFYRWGKTSADRVNRTVENVNRGIIYVANDPSATIRYAGKKIKNSTGYMMDGITWTGQKITNGYIWGTQKMENAVNEYWSHFSEWSKNNISPFFTGLQNGSQKLYEKSMRGIVGYTKIPLDFVFTSVFRMNEEEAQRASNLLTNGWVATTSEVIFHPINSGKNIVNVVRNCIQRAVYTPKKHNSIPNNIKDPIIMAIYHICNKDTLIGHAALWYQGQTIDSRTEATVPKKCFSTNEAIPGEEKTSWGKSGPFHFDMNKNCDLYVIDAAKLGFDTPEKKREFLNNILKEQQNKLWDINNRNCSTIVNKVTNDAFVDTNRATNSGWKNFDFPLSIGANLDRKCKKGIAYALTTEAVVKYGQSLARNENKADGIKELSSNTADYSPPLKLTSTKEKKEVNNIIFRWLQTSKSR